MLESQAMSHGKPKSFLLSKNAITPLKAASAAEILNKLIGHDPSKSF